MPFVKAIVPEVDVAAGTLTLTPPTGLFEELPDDEPESAEPGAEETAAPKAGDSEPDASTPDAAEPDAS